MNKRSQAGQGDRSHRPHTVQQRRNLTSGGGL